MKMSIDTYFCFCCLSTNDLTNIFSNDSDANYGKDIFQVFHLNISYEDYEYDGYICDDCIKRLKEAVRFKEQVFDVLNILQSNGLIEINNKDQQVIVKKVATDNTDTEKKCENIIVTNTITLELTECTEIQSPIKKESDTTEPPIERDKAIQPAEKKEKQITRYEVTKDLKCEVCGEELPNAYVYHSHMNQHFPNHICEACGKGFLTEKRLKRHMQSHKTGLFNCQSCDAKFTNCNSLNSHRQRKHSAIELYACPHCPARFGTLTRRALHLAREHARPPARYRCPACPKLFILRGNLSSHMLNTHQKVKRHWCGECGAGFFQRQELEAHSASHTAQYQFHCHHCPKRYARKKALVVHMRTHTDERRFSCEVCGKRFIQKCTLLVHLKIHSRTADKSAVPDK